MTKLLDVAAPAFRNLSSAPGATARHHWADWAEILLFTAPYGEMTVSDFAERIERRRDFFPAELDEDADLGAEEEDEPLADMFQKPRESRDGAWEAEFRDATVKRAREVFELVSARARAYGEDYPFIVDERSLEMELKESLTARQRVYVFLLACSSLKYVTAPLSTMLPALFEVISKFVLEDSHAGAYEVRLFGSNSYEKSDFTGHIQKKIADLARWLDEEPLLTRASFKPTDSGDGGLDLVARLRTRDGISGSALVFGQCACTPGWITKQHSSSFSVWGSRMTFTAPPVNSAFIPHDFRGVGRDWYARQDIHSSVIYDRCRFLQFMSLETVLYLNDRPEVDALVKSAMQEGEQI